MVVGKLEKELLLFIERILLPLVTLKPYRARTSSKCPKNRKMAVL